MRSILISIMPLGPTLLQVLSQTHTPLLNLCHLWMLPIPFCLPRLTWGLKLNGALGHPLTQDALMKSVEVELLRDKVVRNHNKCSRDADWNGVVCDGEKMGLQAEDATLWFPTISFSYYSKDPHLFESIIPLSQLLVIKPDSHSRYKLNFL